VNSIARIPGFWQTQLAPLFLSPLRLAAILVPLPACARGLFLGLPCLESLSDSIPSPRSAISRDTCACQRSSPCFQSLVEGRHYPGHHLHRADQRRRLLLASGRLVSPPPHTLAEDLAASPQVWPILLGSRVYFSTLWIVLAFFVVLFILVARVELGILKYAYERIGTPPRYVLGILLLSLLGSAINIPIAEFPPEKVVSGGFVDFHGVRYVVPVGREWPGTVLAVNVGGALIPVILSVYLLVKNKLYVRVSWQSQSLRLSLIHWLVLSQEWELAFQSLFRR